MHDLDVTEEMKATVKVIQLPTSTRAGQVRSPRRPKPARLGGTWAWRAWRALCGAHPVLGSVLGDGHVSTHSPLREPREAGIIIVTAGKGKH